MPDSAVYPGKPTRAGGWHRKVVVLNLRDNGPQTPQDAPRAPIAFINRLTHTKGRIRRPAVQPAAVAGAHSAAAVQEAEGWAAAVPDLPVDAAAEEREDGARGGDRVLWAAGRWRTRAPKSIRPAADRDQAGLVFGVAAQMIRNDPELDAECYIVESRSGSCIGRAAVSTGRFRRKRTASTASMRRW